MSDRAPSWAEGARQRMSASSAPRAAAATAARRIPAHWPRRAMVIAVGLTGSILLAATIIWALGRSGPRDVPVIEADSRPFRVRPEGISPTPPAPPANANARPGETRLAAPAEAPRPELLRQQPAATQAAAPAPAAAQPRQATPATPPAAAPAQPRPGAPAGQAPAAQPPAPQASAAQAQRQAVPAQPGGTPPAAAPAASPTQRPAGRAQVQLAAAPSEEAARAEWDRLRRRHPELASLTPRFQRIEREGQAPLWRVRATGVADAEAARSLCAAIRQRGGGCNPV